MTATKSGLSAREAEDASPILVITPTGAAVQSVQGGGRAREKEGSLNGLTGRKNEAWRRQHGWVRILVTCSQHLEIRLSSFAASFLAHVKYQVPATDTGMQR